MAQQTAVEWLRDELFKAGSGTPAAYSLLFEQAKQMEKEQHGKTWLDSTTQFANDARMDSPIIFDDYYNETYGK